MADLIIFFMGYIAGGVLTLLFILNIFIDIREKKEKDNEQNRD